MLDLEQKCFLLCWAKSKLSYDVYPCELSTPKISDIQSTSDPVLNNIPNIHNGEFFTQLLNIKKSIQPTEDYSLLSFFSQIHDSFAQLGLNYTQSIKRIHFTYSDELTKWDLLQLCFLLRLLTDLQEFSSLIKPSSHLPYTLPIILSILSNSIQLVLYPVSTPYKFNSYASSPTTLNKLNIYHDGELQTIKARYIDLESNYLRLKNLTDLNQTRELTEQETYSGLFKIYLDTIYTLERQILENNSKSEVIYQLKLDLLNLQDECDVLKEQNLKLRSENNKISLYQTEVLRLQEIQSAYHELQQNYHLSQDSVKELKDSLHDLNIRLSVSEAKKSKADEAFIQLHETIRQNLQLNETLKKYEQELQTYRTKLSVVSRNQDLVSVVSSPLCYSPSSQLLVQNSALEQVERVDVGKMTFLEELQFLVKGKDLEIARLNSQNQIYSSEISNLTFKLKESCKLLGTKDQELISKNHEIKTIQRELIQSRLNSSGLTLPETPINYKYSLGSFLGYQNSESVHKEPEIDQMIDKHRRSSIEFREKHRRDCNTPGYSLSSSNKLTESYFTKQTRIGDTPFCIESDMKRGLLTPIISEKYTSGGDSEDKDQAVSTCKDIKKGLYDYLNSVPHK